MSQRPEAGHDPRSDRELLHDVERVRQGPAVALGLVVGIVVAVAAVLAIVQNGDDVRFEWAVFDADAPLWLLLIASMVGGAVLWSLLRAAAARGRSHRAQRRRAVKELESRDGLERRRSFA